MEQFLKFNSNIQRQIAINLFPSEQKKLCSLMGNKSICNPDDVLWKERLKNEMGLTLSAKDIYYLVDGLSRKSKDTYDYLIEFIKKRDISDIDIENISWSDVAAEKIFSDDELLKKYVNSTDKRGRPLLTFAVIRKGSSFVKKILELGANPNIKTDYPPIVLAAEPDDNEIVDSLLKKGANVNTKDINGKTALIVATDMDNKNNVEFLLKAGADPTHANKKGKTALDYAFENGNKDIIDILQKAIEKIK